jgi:hypothetical protein
MSCHSPGPSYRDDAEMSRNVERGEFFVKIDFHSLAAFALDLGEV